MRLKIGKINWIVFALLLTEMVGHGLVFSQESYQEDELNQIKSRIEHNKSVIKEKRQAKKAAEHQLGQLAKELKFTEFHLQKTRQSLQVTEQKVKQTESQLGQTKQAYTIKSQLFARRILDIFKNKHFGSLEFIFSPKNALSALDASYYFERIIHSDVSLISDIKSQYGQLVQQNVNLKTQTQTLAEIKQDIQKKEVLLFQKKVEQNRVVQSLKDQIQDMERMNRELEKSSQEITSKIMRMARGMTFLGTGRFLRPVQAYVSSLFGYRRHPIFKRRIFHNGMDFAAKIGQRIRASDSGVVIVAGEHPQYYGYGKITIIDHGVKNGRRLATVYAHQSQIFVHEGQSVRQGEDIGCVGSTGYSTGPHLHFEVRLDGVPVNPAGYLNL